MDKLRKITAIIEAAAAGLLPPGWQPLANLIEHGVDEVFNLVDRERELKGLTWQQLEEQLGAELKNEKQEWARLNAKLDADGKQ